MGFEPTRTTDPYNQYRTEAIQKNRSGSSSDEGEPLKKEALLTLYAVLILLRKVVTLFEATSEAGLTTTEEAAFLQHLTMLKNAFSNLKREDRSQDSTFLNYLSQIWHLLLKDGSRLRPIAMLAIQFFKLIEEFRCYPAAQEHTLGYYLTECSGHKWLPFPYMEIIYVLHVTYLAHPDTSQLSSWIRQIEKIISSIKSGKN